MKLTKDYILKLYEEMMEEASVRKSKGKGILPEHKECWQKLFKLMKEKTSFDPSKYNITKTYERNYPIIDSIKVKRDTSYIYFTPKEEYIESLKPFAAVISKSDTGSSYINIIFPNDDVDYKDSLDSLKQNVHYAVNAGMDYVPIRYLKRINVSEDDCDGILKAQDYLDYSLELLDEITSEDTSEEQEIEIVNDEEDSFKHNNEPFTIYKRVPDFEHSGDTERFYNFVMSKLKKAGLTNDVKVTTDYDDEGDGYYEELVLKGKGSKLKQQVEDILNSY